MLGKVRPEMIMRESPILTAVEIEQLARFDEHWRVILAADNRLLAQALAQRGYLDVLKRRVPLYRLSALGREVLSNSRQGEGKRDY